MNCNSQALYGCEYYVHSTELASQLGKPVPYMYITPNLRISLGNPAQDRYGMNAQHKNLYFSLQSLVFIDRNTMEREN